MPSIVNARQHARPAPLLLSHAPALQTAHYSGAASAIDAQQEVNHTLLHAAPSPGLVLSAPKELPSLAPIAAARNAEDVCPITQESLSDIDVLIVAQDGYAYDREALRAWLARSNLSPMTRLPMPETVQALFGTAAALEKHTDAAAEVHIERTLRQAIPHLLNAGAGVYLLHLANPERSLTDMIPAALLAACAGVNAGILVRSTARLAVGAAGRLSALRGRQGPSDLEMQTIA